MTEDDKRSNDVTADDGQTHPTPEPDGDKIEAPPAGAPRLSTATTVVGGVATLLFLFFFAFGRVTVHLSDGDTERMRVRDVWATVRDDLPSISQPAILTTIYVIAVVMTVAGSIAGLWIALSAGPEIETSGRAASPDP